MEVAEIYGQFHQSLLAFIRSKIRSNEDAQDILQNVFIKLSANVNNLADEEKLKSWIFTITRNTIIDYYRTNASKKNVEIVAGIEESIWDEEDFDTTKGLDQCVHTMIKLL